MPVELIGLFSKAGNAIKAELAAREAEGLPTSSKVADWLAHKLRGPKRREAAPSQHDRWTAEAADHGFAVPGLLAVLRGRGREQQLCETDADALFDRLAGPHGLTAQTVDWSGRRADPGAGGRLAAAERWPPPAWRGRWKPGRTPGSGAGWTPGRPHRAACCARVRRRRADPRQQSGGKDRR